MSKGLSSSICCGCFDRFFINSEEILVPSNMNRLSKNNTNPVNWADWIQHYTTHCPKCRLDKVPQSCLNDLARYTARLR
jgi:hypothetical protein